ncbi:hypothetical protein M1N87_00070 [Dehalococcoidia bacterium]|nr:hypothetical protein [Dehalococcoidia bacterium]
MVSGILGKKIGMTQIFAEDGAVVPVTAIEAGPCMVTQVKSMDADGYNAVQLGFGKSKRLNKPERGHLKKLGTFRHLREFRSEDVAGIEPGQKVSIDMFQPGDIVDVVGKHTNGVRSKITKREERVLISVKFFPLGKGAKPLEKLRT